MREKKITIKALKKMLKLLGIGVGKKDIVHFFEDEKEVSLASFDDKMNLKDVKFFSLVWLVGMLHLTRY